MDISKPPTQYRAGDLLRGTMCVLVDWVDLDKGYSIKPYGRSAPAQEFRTDEFVYITSDLLGYRRGWLANANRQDDALAEALGAQVNKYVGDQAGAEEDPRTRWQSSGRVVKQHTARLGLHDPDIKAARDFLNTPEAKVLRALYQAGAITGTQYTDALEQLRGM